MKKITQAMSKQAEVLKAELAESGMVNQKVASFIASVFALESIDPSLLKATDGEAKEVLAACWELVGLTAKDDEQRRKNIKTLVGFKKPVATRVSTVSGSDFLSVSNAIHHLKCDDVDDFKKKLNGFLNLLKRDGFIADLESKSADMVQFNSNAVLIHELGDRFNKARAAREDGALDLLDELEELKDAQAVLRGSLSLATETK